MIVEYLILVRRTALLVVANGSQFDTAQLEEYRRLIDGCLVSLSVQQRTRDRSLRKPRARRRCTKIAAPCGRMVGLRCFADAGATATAAAFGLFLADGTRVSGLQR